MPCAGVIHRYPGRCLQSGAQHVPRFGEESILPFCQQPLDLTFGDRQADRLQQRCQTGQCCLALMVLHQHEATQVRAEVTLDCFRQWRNDCLSLRRYPAFTPIADRMHRQHKLLNQIDLVALEARSCRGRGLQHPILDADARSDLAAAPTLLLPVGLGRFGATVHATRFDVRATLQSLQPRDLLTLLGNSPLQFGQLREQTGHQLPKLGRRQDIKVNRRDHK